MNNTTTTTMVTFSNATMEALASKLSGFLASTSKQGEIVPCVLTLNQSPLQGHMINSLAVATKGYKFQYVFFNKEGVNKSQPTKIVLDAQKQAVALKGLSLFKSDIKLAINEDATFLDMCSGANSAKQALPAITEMPQAYDAEKGLKVSYTAGTGLVEAWKKALSLDSPKAVSMKIETDGKLYIATTDNNRVAYIKLDEISINQNELMLRAIREAVSKAQSQVIKTLEVKNAELDEEFKKALGTPVSVDEGYQMLKLCIGSNPILAYMAKDGQLAEDARTFLVGSEEQKAAMNSVPAITIDMQGVVQEFFKTFECECFVASKDLKLLCNLFADAEKVKVSVFESCLQIAMDGVAVNVPFCSTDIPPLTALRSVVEKERNTVALIDNVELGTALSFLMDTSFAKKEGAVPLHMHFAGKEVRLSIPTDANSGVVTCTLVNSIPDEVDAFLNLKYLKNALGTTVKGTVCVAKSADNTFSVSGVENEGPDNGNAIVIMGINPKVLAEQTGADIG